MIKGVTQNQSFSHIFAIVSNTENNFWILWISCTEIFDKWVSAHWKQLQYIKYWTIENYYFPLHFIQHTLETIKLRMTYDAILYDLIWITPPGLKNENIIPCTAFSAAWTSSHFFFFLRSFFLSRDPWTTH